VWHFLLLASDDVVEGVKGFSGSGAEHGAMR
jgi:hypothetical protein